MYLRSILLLYSAGSGINRVQVVLSGFNMRLFCFVQTNPLYRYGCMHLLAPLVIVLVLAVVLALVLAHVLVDAVCDERNVMVMSSA